MKCKICKQNTDFFADAKILFKYNIKFFKCPNCFFIQTEDPFWLEESYKEAINFSDIGLLERNIKLLSPTNNIISKYFNPNAKFMDFGAGHGVFVRMMRDRGFDFYWNDIYCNNLFAKDFEYTVNTKYEMVTAYEVFEHLSNPISEIKEMFKFSENILFTTYLVPESMPKPNEWWYYGLDHGQHVSLFSKKSLNLLANEFGKNLITNGKNIHLFTSHKASSLLFKIITTPNISRLFSLFYKRKSLLDKDYNFVLSKYKSKIN